MSDYIHTGHLPPAQPALPASPVAKAEALPHPVAAEKAKPAAPAPAPAKVDPAEARQALQEAAKQLNEQMQRNSRDLSFTVDDMTNTVVVTVKNRQGEVVRQIPNEVALRVAHNLENIKGLLQDEKS